MEILKIMILITANKLFANHLLKNSKHKNQPIIIRIIIIISSTITRIFQTQILSNQVLLTTHFQELSFNNNSYCILKLSDSSHLYLCWTMQILINNKFSILTNSILVLQDLLTFHCITTVTTQSTTTTTSLHNSTINSLNKTCLVIRWTNFTRIN